MRHRPVLAAGLIVALLGWILILRAHRRPPLEPVPPPGPDLDARDLLGCWELSIGPWTLHLPADSVSVAAGEPGLPASVVPPSRVALLPDSADVWSRDLPTARAVPVPLPREREQRSGRVLRWLVRADTLWILWTEGDGRAGVALFGRGDRLVGAARASHGELDAAAPAEAWRINCASLAPRQADPRPRP